MKKFLKTLLIIVLVAASIGGTAYIFYKKLNPPVDYFEELNGYVSSSSTKELSIDLKKVIAKTPEQDTRFVFIDETNNKLNQCLDSLSSYYLVANSHSFNKKAIDKGLSHLKSTRAETINVIDAYITKTTAQGELAVGANPSYEAVSQYFVEYANFIKTLNGELSSLGVDTTSNIKFSVIELYCDVCIDCFSNLTLTFGNLTLISDDSNISQISPHIDFQNSYFKFDNFSNSTNLFIKNYNETNKEEFAENLAKFLLEGSETSLDSNMLAGYYLNQIFGV